MLNVELKKAIAEGKMFLMRKYKSCGEWSAPRLVSAEVAEKKSRVRVVGYDEFDEESTFCPYSFELAE